MGNSGGEKRAIDNDRDAPREFVDDSREQDFVSDRGYGEPAVRSTGAVSRQRFESETTVRLSTCN